MKKLSILIIGIFFTLCIRAQENAQKKIIIAFDVTKSMQCPDANEDEKNLKDTAKINYKGNRYILNDSNPFYEPGLIWEPALEDLKSVIENAEAEGAKVIILPFQDDTTEFSPITNYEDIEKKLKDCGKRGGNTCIYSVWTKAEEYMGNGNFEFYLITDGDEDHDNNPYEDTDDEKNHIDSVKSKITGFKDTYKNNNGYAYYSLLKNSSKSEIHKTLDKTEYFKMKVPGDWDKTEISCEWMSLPYSCTLKFTPIGSRAGEKNLDIKIEASCDDKYFDISDLTFKDNKLEFDIKKTKDSIVNWRKDREGKEYHEFKVTLHTPWSDSDKFFIYDKRLTIRINRPCPEKVEVQDTVKWQFDDEKLDSISKVIIISPPNDMHFNMDNLVVDCKDNTVGSNKPNICLSLINNQIKDGKAIFSIDTTKLKDIQKWDGKYYYTFTVKSNEKSVRQIEPFKVECEISFLNTKSIHFNTAQTQPIEYYKKRAWKDSFSDTISCEVNCELSNFVSNNCSTYKDIKISFHGKEPKEPIIINSNIIYPIQNANNNVSLCLNPESEKLSENKIFSISKDEYHVTAEISNLDGIDKIFWNNKSYEVKDGNCKIEDALIVKAERILNPLSKIVIVILLAFLAAIILHLFKQLYDYRKRESKPKFYGNNIGLHFVWGGNKGCPNLDLSYTTKDGPDLKDEQNQFANESYIHTYLLSETCVEKIVVTQDSGKHIKPFGPNGWTLHIEAVNLGGHQYEGNIISQIEICPINENSVRVNIYTNGERPARTFDLKMDTIGNSNIISDNDTLQLEVYAFRNPIH